MREHPGEDVLCGQVWWCPPSPPSEESLTGVSLEGRETLRVSSGKIGAELVVAERPPT